jgi:hypothetical protein
MTRAVLSRQWLVVSGLSPAPNTQPLLSRWLVVFPWPPAPNPSALFPPPGGPTIRSFSRHHKDNTLRLNPGRAYSRRRPNSVRPIVGPNGIRPWPSAVVAATIDRRLAIKGKAYGQKGSPRRLHGYPLTRRLHVSIEHWGDEVFDLAICKSKRLRGTVDP